ncbi:ABC transporter permease [Tessaracoccus massiliensis]|uniref:ABC transporter permease n=1 Tax=Tessaracoccus massiliensis TaxID=1522311 RepID=UPI00058B3575|nr:proline/glycine betaine ABC transporter permease [Tessaracoccus massiliensis]
MNDWIPRIPVGSWVSDAVDWISVNLRFLLDFFKAAGTWLNDVVTTALLAPPPLVMILIFAVLAWLVRSWRLAIGVVAAFLLILSMNQWTQSMQTLSLVLIATLTAIIIAVPLGIWAARNDTVSAIVKPVLDLMQSLPAMVYLVPAIIFFSIGVVPGLFSTVIFSLPPAVRLTELGIRSVDKETVEAAHSFGATDWEILRGVQLPLAIPSIMAGINQVIMLALSMAVIAGIVGSDGLGKEVVTALGTVSIARGAEAGLSLVFIAIFLDRLTAALGTPEKFSSSLLAKWKAAREKKAKTRESAELAA